MMKQRTSLLGLLGLSLAAAGCADGNAPEQLRQPIIGGTETQADPAVAALVGFKPGESSSSLCTATLISPTVLLTAAHCVDPSVVGEGMQFEARFHHDVRQSPPDTRIPVVRVDWDRAFDAGNLPAGHDIGVAILERPAPGIQPLPYLRQPIDQSSLGRSVRLVGFGLNNGFDTSGTSAGIKRETGAELTAIGERLLEVGGFGNTFCSGDGGGPGLLTHGGVETVVGVNSYGFVFCLAAGYQTRVDLYGDFIAQFLDDPVCVPSCQDKSCGPDGCGQTCGECGEAELCTDAGACQPLGNCPSEREPNDDPALANQFCNGGLAHGTIDLLGDDDWFVIALARSTTYTFLLDDVGASTNFALYARQSGQGGLAKVGDGVLAGNNRLLSRRTTSGGTYYVHVYGLDGASSAQPYRLYSVGFK